jgi:multisubunit Na+/H+ antiporter MnhE subunit
MAKLTIWVGVLLVAVAVGFWLAAGRVESAALHPAGLGVLLVVCGLLANTENAKKRMLWMHIAVTLGLIGFLLPLVRTILQVVKGTLSTATSLALGERFATILLCLVFVGLCVRSFIAARRARTA